MTSDAIEQRIRVLTVGENTQKSRERERVTCDSDRIGRCGWKRVQRWLDGGLSAREFGNEIGVKSTALVSWKHTLKQEGLLPADIPDAPRSRSKDPLDEALGLSGKQPAEKPAKRTAHKAPVVRLAPPVRELRAFTVDTHDTRFELAVGTTTIRVPVGFDENTLRRLLAIARQADDEPAQEPEAEAAEE